VKKKKPSTEEAEFEIYKNGKKIGSEKYQILNDNKSLYSNSVLNFSDPATNSKRFI